MKNNNGSLLRTAVISAKQGTDMRTIIKIDKILQTECGFRLDYKKRQWSKDIESIPGMKAIRAQPVGQGADPDV